MMQSFWHKIIGTFLLAGIVSSVLPLAYLHEHVEVTCVNHSQDIDPCHLEIYHGHISAENTCDHNTHVHSEIKKCEWCKFVKPFRDDFTNYFHSEYFECNTNSELFSELNLTFYSTSSLFKQGRAPPIS